MLFLSERSQLEVHWARLRGGFLIRESIKKIEEHNRELQRLVQEAKVSQEPENMCCYKK